LFRAQIFHLLNSKGEEHGDAVKKACVESNLHAQFRKVRLENMLGSTAYRMGYRKLSR